MYALNAILRGANTSAKGDGFRTKNFFFKNAKKI